MNAPDNAAGEVARGERFGFGENWSRFLSLVDDTRIESAETSVQALLGRPRLDGLRLLDIGSGSGLFSLAARRLGATVYSFDYDPQSVACTTELRRRYSPGDSEWQVERGSVLDTGYLNQLGRFDVVYSWGVLHHTGQMWRAIGNAASLVAPGGTLAIAIYNRQPFLTPLWSGVKRLYVALPLLRPLMVWLYLAYAAVASGVADIRRGQAPWSRWQWHGRRGMNLYYDAVDWVGGWPFEAAAPGEIIEFLSGKGFRLTQSDTVGHRHGCNEFVFERAAA